ncbi:MAG: hypothetical protein KAX31_01445 [Thermoplasmata archaeon]|nr:hypothetical protein [Thermoplasmata archaeon]
MAVANLGITMYDIRTTLKVLAVTGITQAMSVYIDANGANRCDADNDVVHEWALTTVGTGDELTIATTCRMNVDTAQTIGARLYTGNVAAGSAPSTTFAAVGVVCGFAVTAAQVFCNVPTPAADG